jgi:hypothetical protein
MAEIRFTVCLTLGALASACGVAETLDADSSANSVETGVPASDGSQAGASSESEFGEGGVGGTTASGAESGGNAASGGNSGGNAAGLSDTPGVPPSEVNGGATEAGGSGGSMPTAIASPDFNFGLPFRFQVPCLFDVYGADASTSYCHESNVCWLTADQSNQQLTAPIPMAGDPAVTYDVTLRIRGVIEAKRYPKHCQPLESDEPMPALRVCRGTEDQGPSTFDTWQLSIAEPPQIYYLNSSDINAGHESFTIDTHFTVQLRGGTTVFMHFDDINGGLISNCKELSFPEIESRAFNGNWIQLDAVDWIAQLPPTIE